MGLMVTPFSLSSAAVDLVERVEFHQLVERKSSLRIKLDQSGNNEIRSMIVVATDTGAPMTELNPSQRAAAKRRETAAGIDFKLIYDHLGSALDATAHRAQQFERGTWLILNVLLPFRYLLPTDECEVIPNWSAGDANVLWWLLCARPIEYRGG
jgi:hypothetical protein